MAFSIHCNGILVEILLPIPAGGGPGRGGQGAYTALGIRTAQTSEERGMDKRKGNMIRGILVAVILVAVLAAPQLFGAGSGSS